MPSILFVTTFGRVPYENLMPFGLVPFLGLKAVNGQDDVIDAFVLAAHSLRIPDPQDFDVVPSSRIRLRLGERDTSRPSRQGFDPTHLTNDV